MREGKEGERAEEGSKKVGKWSGEDLKPNPCEKETLFWRLTMFLKPGHGSPCKSISTY